MKDIKENLKGLNLASSLIHEIAIKKGFWEEKTKILEKTKELTLKNIELDTQIKEKQAKIDALNELNNF